MYNQFFGLRENPFNVNPDPRYLFLTRQTRESFEGLTHGIKNRKGLLLLTGEAGTGKTTLLNHLLDWLHRQHTPAAFIFNSHLEVSHLFDFVLADFAVKFDSQLKDNALLRLRQWLLDRYRAGETPVLIVDEAQGLRNHVLEEIRMLLNLETCNEKLLQVVLAGQPELEDRLQRPALRQVKQRIALRCKTAALSLPEAHRYIQARLHIAGADDAHIFSYEAMDAAHFYSRGIPRVMNLLCEHALLNASVEQIQRVPEHFVAEVAREFQFDDIKPVASYSVSREGPYSAAISVQSRFMNALVSLTAPAEPVLRQSPVPSPIPSPDWSAPEDNVFSPVQTPAPPVLDCKKYPGDDASDAAIAVPSSIPSAVPAAPWQEHLQTRLLSDWTAFFIEVGSALPSVAMTESAAQLAMQQAKEPAPPAHPPRLHLVESKPASGHPSATTRSHLAGPQEFSHPSFKVAATKSALLGSSITKLIALRLTLVRWGMKWSNRFLTTAAISAWAPPPAILLQLPARTRRHLKVWFGVFLARAEKVVAAIASPAWTRTMNVLLQLPARALGQIKAWFGAFVVGAEGFVVALASVDWQQLKITTSRWLRQPCDPTQWRLQDSHLFEQMFRFNHKKL
jgi:general secretion pathway protein A